MEKKKFFKPFKNLLDNSVREEQSNATYFFFKENKKGELKRDKKGDALCIRVRKNPTYTITDANGHKYYFDKQRNVNKALRFFGIKRPEAQSLFEWSDDASFECGNGKITKHGYAISGKLDMNGRPYVDYRDKDIKKK